MDYFKNLKDLLFIDIETVSCCETYDQLDLKLQPLWDRKAFYINHTKSNKELYEDKAAIFAEFGKIITISLGFFYLENDKLCFKIKSLFGDDEVKILNDFNQLIEKKSNNIYIIIVKNPRRNSS